MRNISLVLTATIKPNVEFVARNDVQQRLSDYLKCAKFYLENTDYKLIFVENSGYDLDSSSGFDAVLKNDRFVWKRVDPNPDLTKGKGFQEFFMLDTVVRQEIPGDYFVKVTGRYLVRNVNSIVAKMNTCMHIDLHQKMKVAITGFFGVETAFYRDHFYGKYADANDNQGRFIEHVVYDTIIQKNLIQSVSLLPENVLCEGVSGSHGNSMARNPYKMKLRSVERSINRALGIKKFLIEY